MISIVCSSENEPLLSNLLGPFQRINSPESGFFLSFADDVLRLCRVADGQGVFVTLEEIDRRLTGDFLLGRACGLPLNGLRILDATGGLGIDAMALARKGASVDIIEREPILWALLKDLIRRTGVDHVSATLADSSAVLADDPVYDVIYLDPMFPPRRKKALPGKRMQYLSALLEESDQEVESCAANLVLLAKSRARRRVVLKRRLKDPLAGAPDWRLKGRSVRYDVYRGLA